MFLKGKNVVLVLLLSLIHILVWASMNSSDSLELRLNNASDKDKIDLFIQLSKLNWTKAPSKGLFYANEAIKLSEKSGDNQSEAKAYLYGGVNAYFMGSYDDAIVYYQKSLSLARELNNDKLCAFNLNNLGMVNTYLKNYKNAIENYKESLKIINAAHDTIESAKIQNNIAELHMLMGNTDSALMIQLNVLSLVEKSEEKVFLIWLYNDIGKVYILQKNYAKALKYLNKSLELSVQINNYLGISKAMNQIGLVHMQTNAFEKARQYFTDAFDAAQRTQAKESVNESYKNISSYYAATGNYKQSLAYYKRHKQLSDSILNDEKMRTIVEMQARYELESTSNENQMLRKNIELNELRIKKDKIVKGFLSVLFLLSFLLFILIHNQMLIKKRKNEALNQKNKLIEEQKNQLSETLHELKQLNDALILQKEAIQESKKELETLNIQLSETNASKDKFFSILAHDLKSPFNALLGLTKILDDNFETYEIVSQKKIIKSVHQGLKDTFNLLENLLQWANAQRGTITFKPEPTNLLELFKNSIQLLQQMAQNKSIELAYEIPDNVWVNVDTQMISTVFRNLLSNAIKFTERGTTVFVKADSWQNGNYIEIVVKDQGIGIPTKLLNQLFDLNGPRSTPGTENEKGTGLGLVLCLDFVEKHGGTIWAESTMGKGSSFYFTLPLATIIET